MKSNTIGFNNFKSFGDKVQTFSKKPITLIYGPNSIGKSSCLHFLLYMEYLKESGEVNLEKSDFAGDPIDLGGFGNFVHKKDVDKEIAYQLTINNPSDIEKCLPPFYIDIKKFEKSGVFKNEITKNNIINRLKNYRKKDKYVIIIPNYIRQMLNCDIKSFHKDFKPMEDNIFSGYQSWDRYAQGMKRHDLWTEKLGQLESQLEAAQSNQETEEIFQNIEQHLQEGKELSSNLKKGSANSRVSEQEQKRLFKEILDPGNAILFEENFQNSDESTFDALDKLVLYILDNRQIFARDRGLFDTNYDFDEEADGIEDVANIIQKYIKQFHRIAKIKSILLDFKFAFSNKNSYQFNCFIDGFQIFNYDSKTNQLVPGDDNNFLLEVRDPNAPTFVHELSEKAFKAITMNLFNLDSFATELNFPLEYFYGNSGIIRSIYELTTIHLREGNLRPSQYLGPLRFYPKRSDLFHKPYDKSASSSRHRYVITTETLSTVRRFPIRIAKYFLVFQAQFWRTVFNSLKLQDSFNELRKNNKKVSSSHAMNSEKMWSEFINSPEIQIKVNKWLSDESKVKTPYTAKVTRSTNTSFFRKLFGLPPIETNQLMFFDKRTDTQVTPREMGLGISQFLPILVATKTLENYQIFIEQPELHLHPGVQCEIADEIIRSTNSQNNEFIVETHSEHLLLRIMKRLRHTAEGTIAKGDELALTPDDVCLLYVDNNDDLTFINELELDKDGSLLDPWPHGFFEEGYNERFN